MIDIFPFLISHFETGILKLCDINILLKLLYFFSMALMVLIEHCTLIFQDGHKEIKSRWELIQEALLNDILTVQDLEVC